MRNLPQLRFARAQMEKVVGTRDVTDAGMGQFAKHTHRGLTNRRLIRRKQIGWQ